MKVYLYIKVHNVTGLKYFGKTVQDPMRYKGSGNYWKEHIKKYGYDVTTTIFGSYEDGSKELTEVALEFSKVNDIVNNDKWANLVPEDGINQGGSFFKGHKHTAENREAFANQLREIGVKTRFKKGQVPHNLGGKHTDECKVKMSKASKGRVWVNKNGKSKKPKECDVQSFLDDGYVLGRFK